MTTSVKQALLTRGGLMLREMFSVLGLFRQNRESFTGKALYQVLEKCLTVLL